MHHLLALGCMLPLLFAASPDPKRYLLVFGEATSPFVVRQQQLLEAGMEGMKDRDLLAKWIRPGDSLYNRFHVSPDAAFTVVLIGKDGGEKYRSRQPVALADLFAIIDAMPMRRAEMRTRRNSPRPLGQP